MISRELQSVIDVLPGLVLVVREDGAIVGANPMLHRMLDPGGDPVGRTLVHIAGPQGDRPGAYLRRCAAADGPVRGLLVFRTGAGPVECRCDGALVRAPDGSRLVLLQCKPAAALLESEERLRLALAAAR